MQYLAKNMDLLVLQCCGEFVVSKFVLGYFETTKKNVLMIIKQGYGLRNPPQLPLDTHSISQFQNVAIFYHAKKCFPIKFTSSVVFIDSIRDKVKILQYSRSTSKILDFCVEGRSFTAKDSEGYRCGPAYIQPNCSIGHQLELIAY